MSVRSLARSQRAQKLDLLRRKLADTSRPQSGWLAFVREALGMTTTQLAKRADVIRSYVSNAEQAEQAESITFKRMKRLADAMNCDFVYFLVPRTEIDAMIEEQATKVARNLLHKAGEHMSLEGQQLETADQEREVKRLAQELIVKMPRSFWDDDK